MNDALGETTNGANGANGGLESMSVTIGNIGSKVVSGAVESLKNLVSSLFEAIEATEEYRSMQAKLQGSAENFGYSVEYASTQYENLYKYLGDSQMATNAITNLMGLGLETSNLDSLVNGAIATWTAYGDSIPIESLTESMSESIKVGSVTGTLADTINWASLSQQQWNSILGEGSASQEAFNNAVASGESQEDAFSSALGVTTDMTERANMVQALLNTTYGESKSTYDQLNSSQLELNEAENQLTATQAELAEAVMPLQTALTTLKTQALQALAPIIENVCGALSNFITWLNEGSTMANVVKGVLSTLAIVVGGLLAIFAGASIITTITTAIGTLTSVITTVVGIIQAIISGVTTLLSVIGTVASVATVITAVIAGVVAVLIYLYNTNETFRDIVNSCWEAVKNAISSAIDSIVSFFQNIPNAISSLISWFQQIPSNVSSALSSAISSVASFVGSFASYALQAGQQFLTNIVGTMQQIPSQMLSVGINIVSGIKNGIAQGWSQLTSWLGNQAKGLVNTVKSFLGIASPSKLFASEVGYWLPSGISVGFADATPQMIEDMEKQLDFANRQLQFTALEDMNWFGNANQARLGTSGNTVTNNNGQTIIFNQPVETPDEMARTARLKLRYGY